MSNISTNPIWCPECGELMFHKHQCPPQWITWRRDDGEDSRHRRVYAKSAEQAAFRFAEIECEDADLYQEYLSGEVEIQVKRSDQITLDTLGTPGITVSVFATQMVEFHARQHS